MKYPWIPVSGHKPSISTTMTISLKRNGVISTFMSHYIWKLLCATVLISPLMFLLQLLLISFYCKDVLTEAFRYLILICKYIFVRFYMKIFVHYRVSLFVSFVNIFRFNLFWFIKKRFWINFNVFFFQICLSFLHWWTWSISNEKKSVLQ